MLGVLRFVATSAVLACPFSKAPAGAPLPPGHPELPGDTRQDSVAIWLGNGERIGIQTLPPSAAEESPAVDFGTVASGGFSRRLVVLRSGAALANVTARSTPLLLGASTAVGVDGSGRQQKSGPVLQTFQQGFLYQHYHPKHRGLDRQKAGVALPGYLPETVMPIPRDGFPLAADRTSIILLELWIPPSATPGLYSAILTVAGHSHPGGGNTDLRRELSVTVRVVPGDGGNRGGVAGGSIAGVVQRSLSHGHGDDSDAWDRSAPGEQEEREERKESSSPSELHAAANEYLHRGDDIQQQRWNMFLGVHNIPSVPFCSVATGSLFRWCT